VLLDTTFVCFLTLHPEAGMEQLTSSAKVGCYDFDAGVTDTVLVQSLLQVLWVCVPNVVDGAVSPGGTEPNRGVE
jgi:hypothetical protein